MEIDMCPMEVCQTLLQESVVVLVMFFICMNNMSDDLFRG